MCPLSAATHLMMRFLSPRLAASASAPAPPAALGGGGTAAAEGPPPCSAAAAISNLCALGAEWLQDSHLFALLLRHGHALDAVASLFAASFVVSYAWGLLTSCLPRRRLGLLRRPPQRLRRVLRALRPRFHYVSSGIDSSSSLIT